MTDDLQEAALLDRVTRFLEAEDDLSAFPGMPSKDYPEPVRKRYAEEWRELRRSFDDSQIERFVRAFPSIGEENDTFTIPGIVENPITFVRSVGYIAHVRWAMTLETKEALRVLAGELAVRGHKSRNWTKAGWEALNGTEEEAQAQWNDYQKYMDKLRANHPGETKTWLQEQTAKAFGVSTKTIWRRTK